MFHVESDAFGQEKARRRKTERKERTGESGGVGPAITWSRRYNAHATDRCTLQVVARSTYSSVPWGLLVVYRTDGNVP